MVPYAPSLWSRGQDDDEDMPTIYANTCSNIFQRIEKKCKTAIYLAYTHNKNIVRRRFINFNFHGKYDIIRKISWDYGIARLYYKIIRYFRISKRSSVKQIVKKSDLNTFRGINSQYGNHFIWYSILKMRFISTWNFVPTFNSTIMLARSVWRNEENQPPETSKFCKTQNIEIDVSFAVQPCTPNKLRG